MDFTFAENLEVEDINKVPENFRGFYDKPEGETKHKLRLADPVVKVATDSITGLNKSLKAARAEAQSFKSQRVDLSPLKDYGTTVDEIANGVTTKLSELQQQLEKGGKVNVEKIKQELAATFAEDGKKKDTRITALTGQLYQHLVTSAATMAIAEAKGVPELLMPFVKDRVKVVEKDGNFIVHVVDEAGDIRFSGTTGKEMSIKELVDEMKGNTKYARLFESEQASGGGSSGGNRPAGGGGGGNQSKQVSSLDKIRMGLTKGQAARK